MYKKMVKTVKRKEIFQRAWARRAYMNTEQFTKRKKNREERGRKADRCGTIRNCLNYGLKYFQSCCIVTL